MRTWEIRTWRLVLILISLVAPLSSVSAQVSQGRVQSMKLLMANVGWATTDYVVMGRGAAGRLFWTTTAGAQWKDITPSTQSPEAITAVFFLDTARGWVLLREFGADQDAPQFDLASTTNAGSDWSIAPVKLPNFNPRATSLTGDGRIAFSDPLHGWMNLDVMSSSAFQLGMLLMTSDGGRTWCGPLNSPGVEGAINPVTPDDIWLAGGPGEELFVTHDAGYSWQQLDLKAPKEIYPAIDATYDVPTFSDAKHGLLPVIYSGVKAKSAAVLFKTADSGRTWQVERILAGLRESSVGQRIVSAVSDSVWFTATISDDRLIFSAIGPNGRTNNDVTQYAKWSGARWATASQLSFVDAKRGWMLSTGRLLLTSDGGATWTATARPSKPHPGGSNLPRQAPIRPMADTPGAAAP